MAAKNTTKKSYSRCICGLCERIVLGNFAQGHDAKLVSVASSFVVGAGSARESVPGGHWLDQFGSDQGTDIEDRIQGAYSEFVIRTSPALADKFDRAARNLWASAASKSTRAAAKAESKASKAERGAERAAKLQAKLEASGKALHVVAVSGNNLDTHPEADTAEARESEEQAVRPIKVAATCGTCGALANEPCTRKDGRRMSKGARHADHA